MPVDLSFLPDQPKVKLGKPVGGVDLSFLPDQPDAATPGAGFLEFPLFGKKGPLAQAYRGLTESITSPLSLIGTGIGKIAGPEVGKTVSEFLHVKPPVEEPKGMGEKIGRSAGYLLGMAIPVTWIGKVGFLNKITNPLMRTAAVGGLWGFSEDTGYDEGTPEDMGARLENAKSTAAIFGAFHLAGTGVEKVFIKSPLFKNAIKKLTPGRQAQYSELIKSGTLGFGAGLTEPAEDFKERLQNATIGAAAFGIAHLPYMRQIAKGANIEAMENKIQDTRIQNFKDMHPEMRDQLERILKDKQITDKANIFKKTSVFKEVEVKKKEVPIGPDAEAEIMRRAYGQELEKLGIRLDTALGRDAIEQIKKQVNYQEPDKWHNAFIQLAGKPDPTVVVQRGKDLFEIYGKRMKAIDVADYVHRNPDVFPGIGADRVNRLKFLTEAHEGIVDMSLGIKGDPIRTKDLADKARMARGEIGARLMDVERIKPVKADITKQITKQTESISMAEPVADILSKLPDQPKVDLSKVFFEKAKEAPGRAETIKPVPTVAKEGKVAPTPLETQKKGIVPGGIEDLKQRITARMKMAHERALQEQLRTGIPSTEVAGAGFMAKPRRLVTKEPVPLEKETKGILTPEQEAMAKIRAATAMEPVDEQMGQRQPGKYSLKTSDAKGLEYEDTQLKWIKEHDKQRTREALDNISKDKKGDKKKLEIYERILNQPDPELPRELVDKPSKVSLPAEATEYNKDLGLNAMKRKFTPEELHQVYTDEGSKSMRFFIGDDPRPWMYYEHKGKAFVQDGSPRPVNSELEIRGLINDSSTGWAGGMFHKETEPNAKEHADIDAEKDVTMRAYKMFGRQLKKEPFFWMDWDRMWRNTKGIAEGVGVGKWSPELMRKTTEITGLESKTSRMESELFEGWKKRMTDAGVYNKEDSRAMAMIADYIVVDPNNTGNAKEWGFGRKASPQVQDEIRAWLSGKPEALGLIIESKDAINKATWDYLKDNTVDYDVWRDKTLDGYFPRYTTYKEGTAEFEESMRGSRGGGKRARATFERSREAKTFEEYEAVVREANLVADVDFASLTSKALSERMLFKGVKESLKDLRGMIDPKTGKPYLIYTSPKDDASKLATANYTQIGQRMRWLNAVLPSGAQRTAWVSPDLAKELRYLYQGGTYGASERAYKGLQNKIRQLILFQPFAVGADIVPAALSILGVPEFAKALAKSTPSLKAFFGKAEIPFIATPQEQAKLDFIQQYGDLVYGKELIFKSLDMKQKEANASFEPAQRGQLNKMWEYVAMDHMGTSSWLWGTLNNVTGKMAVKVYDKAIKDGFQPKDAARMSAMVVNDGMMQLPNRIWSKDTAKMMGLVLLARSYTTATFRMATGAFPGLEKVLPIRALQHEAATQKARDFMTTYYRKILINQAVAMVVAGNLVQLAFTGHTMDENEYGHRMDIELPWTKPTGEKLYMQAPFFRQVESLVRFMPQIVGKNVGLPYETSTYRWFLGKMDPVLREVITQLQNHDVFTGEGIMQPGATDVENIMLRLQHATGRLTPQLGLPQERAKTAPELIGPLLGLRVTPGRVGGTMARKVQEAEFKEQWRKEKIRRKVLSMPPGSPGRLTLLKQMYPGNPAAVRSFLLKEKKPNIFLRKRAIRAKVPWTPGE